MSLRSGTTWADPHDAASSVLAGLDPITTAPDRGVIAAVILFIRAGRGSAEERLLWAHWAYRSITDLVGDRHPLWRQVAELYRRVLAGNQLTVEEIRVSERLVASYRAAGRPLLVLSAQCALARAWHHHGHCDLAGPAIREVLSGWLADPGSPVRPRSGARILLAAAEITAGCGDTEQAAELMRSHADLLAGLRDLQRWHAAGRLYISDSLHSANCLYGPVPAVGGADRVRFWRQLLGVSNLPGPIPPVQPQPCGALPRREAHP